MKKILFRKVPDPFTTHITDAVGMASSGLSPNSIFEVEIYTGAPHPITGVFTYETVGQFFIFPSLSFAPKLIHLFLQVMLFNSGLALVESRAAYVFLFLFFISYSYSYFLILFY